MCDINLTLFQNWGYPWTQRKTGAAKWDMIKAAKWESMVLDIANKMLGLSENGADFSPVPM